MCLPTQAGGGGGEDDHIHIIIRKQLTHPELLYKRMGVFGGATFVACVGAILGC